MNTFTIDTHNRVAAHDVDVTVPDDTVKFASDVELAGVTEDWPTTRLVELWNKLQCVAGHALIPLRAQTLNHFRKPDPLRVNRGHVRTIELRETRPSKGRVMQHYWLPLQNHRRA